MAGPRQRRDQWPILCLALRHEADVVLARQRARLIAELLGFGTVDQTRIATATSEVARNAVSHGGGGHAEYLVSSAAPPALVIRLRDHGAGVGPEALTEKLGDLPLGAGSGLELVRRVMDDVEIGAAPERGTLVTLRKHLPAGARDFGAQQLQELTVELAQRPPETMIEELQLQQQELLAVLDDLSSRQEALQAANRELEETNRGVMALYGEVAQELEDTNRGVVALYAQLDDQAQRLRTVDALKDRFISHLSHEFRTPLHSMLALARLLFEQADGPLNAEQERQVGLIRSSALDLARMVDDLLDLAKIQAGKLRVDRQPVAFSELLAGLRGMFRPLAAEAGLELVFEEQPGLPPLFTDPQKLSQILRNLIGNAIKFTERGEVRVVAGAEGADILCIDVRDTGIGIPVEAQPRIFEEYEQVGPMPGRRVRGTGLGLPLSRKLAALLGGELTMASQPGRGSTFTLRFPFGTPPEVGETGSEAMAQPGPAALETIDAPVPVPAQGPGSREPDAPVALVIDDDPGARYLVERLLAELGWRIVHAATGEQGLALALEEPCRLVVLDLALPVMTGYEVLDRLQGSERLRRLPVVVFTSAVPSPEQLERLEAASEEVVFKYDERFGAAIQEVARRLVTGSADFQSNEEAPS